LFLFFTQLTLTPSEHRKNENQRGTGVEATSGLGQSTTGPTTTSSGHHLGRDAAVGVGGVGLAEQYEIISL